jgi:hypothetical protein
MYLSKEKKEVGALSNTKYFHSGYYNHFVLSGINMIPLNARMLRRIPVTSIPLVVFFFLYLHVVWLLQIPYWGLLSHMMPFAI